MNIYKLVVSAIALSLIGSGVYYYNAYQKAKKDLELNKAQYRASRDTLRQIRNKDSQLIAKLSFPSDDSLRSYVSNHFTAKDLFGKAEGTPQSATEFTWQGEDLQLENEARPDSSSENTSLFSIDYTNDHYRVGGDFVVSGFLSGQRMIDYNLRITPKPQVFRIITTQSSFNQEVFIETNGQVLALQSFHSPNYNSNTTEYFYAESGVLAVGNYASGYAAFGYFFELLGINTYSSFGLGYSKNGISPVASVRAVYRF